MRFKILLFLLFGLLISSCNRNGHQEFQGYVEGENTYLASPYFGILQTLKVERGQHVTKGQLLFSLDPNPQQINISQVKGELEQAQNTLKDLEKPRRLPELTAIEAQIEQANAQIKLAAIRVERFQKLFNKQATDKDSLDSALANLQQQQQLKQQYESNLALAKLGGRDDQITAQKGQISSLEAKLKEAEWELNQKTLVAPASGIIFETYFNEGEFVASQQPVVALLEPKNIRIEFFIPLESMGLVQLGKKINFSCTGCRQTNEAIINYVSPDAEFIPPLVYSRENYAKLVFRVKARITDPNSFKPGQPVLVAL